MSPMRSLQNSNTLPCKLRKIVCFILFPNEPEHEINLRGAPYELVPGYFVNSLLVLTTYVIREGSGEHVRLRNLARVSLLTIIKYSRDCIRKVLRVYTKIVYGQMHIPRNNLIVAVLNLGHDEFNIYIGIFMK